MNDKTQCKGEGCPLKDYCYRYPPTGTNYQFTFTPYDKESSDCEFYINDKKKS